MDRKVVGRGQFFVYVLKWDDAYYIGSKTAANANHEELFSSEGKNYRTSSKYVWKYLNEVSYPNSIKIKLFNTPESAYEYETRYLKRVNAKDNKKFLNLHNNEGTSPVLSRELLSSRKKRTFPATNGIETVSMFNDDPRYLSGEYWHVTKGTIMVRDNNNVCFRVKKDDPRYLSGELQSHCKGLFIGKNNPFYGRNHTDETKVKSVQTRVSNNGGFYNPPNGEVDKRTKYVPKHLKPSKSPRRKYTFEEWFDKYVVGKYENWKEINEFILHLIVEKKCFPIFIMREFGLTEAKARSLVDGYDKKYNFKQVNGKMRKLPGRIK